MHKRARFQDFVFQPFPFTKASHSLQNKHFRRIPLSCWKSWAASQEEETEPSYMNLLASTISQKAAEVQAVVAYWDAFAGCHSCRALGQTWEARSLHSSTWEPILAAMSHWSASSPAVQAPCKPWCLAMGHNSLSFEGLR